MTTNWWHPDDFSRRRANLETRAAVISALRRFFDQREFAEVETPILQICPVIDTHILAFATDLKSIDRQIERRLYLHTSPEFAMKKLLVAGMKNIYQICHVFRNAEGSKRHVPEFTMLEWYRAGVDYRAIMQDCTDLLRAVAQTAGIEAYRYRDVVCDPQAPVQEISVAAAFDHYAELDLTIYLGAEGTHRFNHDVAATGIRTAPDDSWDDLFFRVMAEKIEPHLGIGQPTILKDYPVGMASLSRPLATDPRFAERFELYVCGIELANAFSELTDATVQLKRFHEEMASKEKLYGERYPLDEDFIAALSFGMPESGGIALGVDRLVMLACGVEDIADVLWAGRP